jgi:hypothetical protein
MCASEADPLPRKHQGNPEYLAYDRQGKEVVKKHAQY